MRGVTVCRAGVIVLAAFSMIFVPFVSRAEELSSIKIKRIEDAITKLENPARSVQRKGYKEIKYIGTDTVPYLVRELKNKTIGFESMVLLCDILGEYKAKEAVPGLIYNLKNQSYTVQAAACKALGAIGDPTAINPLEGMLKSVDPKVRRAAIEALVNFNDPKIPIIVEGYLKDASEDVRKSAASLLENKLDPATAGALRNALKQDSSPGVRQISAKALGGLKDTEAVGILTEVVIEDPGMGVRQEAAIALGKIGDQKAVEALIKALNDDYKDVQLSAAASLKSLTGKDFRRDHEAWSKWYKAQ